MVSCAKQLIPNSSYILDIQTYASMLGLGAVLNVIRGGEMLPVLFYSRQLQRAEKRYSVTELEALSMVSAVKHWLH